MHQTIAEISRVNFEKALKAGALERTKACKSGDFEFCRSDEWKGDLISFALSIVKSTLDQERYGTKLDLTGI